jgi:hypothetical protein
MTGRGEVARLKGRLDAAFSRAPSSSSDIELQADFAKYLCILVSGFLENSIVALILDYVQRRSALEVTAFVEAQLDYWTNPNTDKICSLLGSFSTDWRKQSEGFLVDERKAAVNSLVALRHKIAHGDSVGTSMSQVKQYYSTAQKVIGFVTELVEIPQTSSTN